MTKTMSNKHGKRKRGTHGPFPDAQGGRPIYSSPSPQTAPALRHAARCARLVAICLDDCAGGAPDFERAMRKAQRLAEATDAMREALLACNATALLPPGTHN